MISLTDIPFYSLRPSPAAILRSRPRGLRAREQIVGLGELARVVDFCARKPQFQDHLTEQVVACLERELRPVGAMVVLQARHLCVEMRGVHNVGALTAHNHQRPARRLRRPRHPRGVPAPGAGEADQAPAQAQRDGFFVGVEPRWLGLAYPNACQLDHREVLQEHACDVQRQTFEQGPRWLCYDFAHDGRHGRDVQGIIEHVRARRLGDIRLNLDVHQEHPRQVVLAAVRPVPTCAA